MKSDQEKWKQVIHDLNGSLTVIQGFLRVMENKIALKEKPLFEAAQQSLKKIKHTLEELNQNP